MSNCRPSVTFSHDLLGRLGTVDLGLTYGLTDNLQPDAGVNIGVTDSADDLVPFVGLSCRF
ncbi:MAG TPA: hypothetical protein VMB21_00610 [Candidatus Limnocylindria bacterium]|jgi:hypothetical protein|nr:hypothetical protein [Candidatus Limnocylindria bacterium]